MRKVLISAMLITALLLFSGCGATIGMYPHIASTQTELAEKNFTVVKTGITGSASAWYLLNTIPLGDTELYKQAMNEIRKEAGIEGKPYAIINVTQDISTTTYLVVSRAKITLTVDVVEFIA